MPFKRKSIIVISIAGACLAGSAFADTSSYLKESSSFRDVINYGKANTPRSGDDTLFSKSASDLYGNGGRALGKDQKSTFDFPANGKDGDKSKNYFSGAGDNAKYGDYLGEFKYKKTDDRRFNKHPIAAPVPEMETWAMMLVGAGIIGYGVRRRQNRRPA